MSFSFGVTSLISISSNVAWVPSNIEDDKASSNKKSSNGKGASNNAEALSSASSLSSKIKDKAKLAADLGIGEITLTDIVSELEKPSRDPRESMPAPILRSDVLDMKDLKPGMVLKGTVRNVIDFGCFVDIGVHQDGLVHISHITDRFIKHPLEAVSVGDIVDVQVLDVEVDKKRISLSMKLRDPAQVAAEAAERAAKRPAQEAAKAAERKARDEEAKKAAKAAAPARKSVVKKTTVKKTETSASAAKSAAGETSATAKKAASKPATATAPATGDAPAPAKKFKKKGIVIFKGNAND